MPASSEDSKYGEDMPKSSANQYNVTEVLVEEDDHDVYVFCDSNKFYPDRVPCISTKPFPVDPNEPEEEYQLTVRAVLVGCVLGAVGASSPHFNIQNYIPTGSVGASNIYLGLKTGFTFGPQLFGVSFSFPMYFVTRAQFFSVGHLRLCDSQTIFQTPS